MNEEAVRLYMMADTDMSLETKIREVVDLVRGLEVMNDVGMVGHIDYDFQFGDWCTDDEFLKRLKIIHPETYTSSGEQHTALIELQLWRDGVKNHRISDNVGMVLMTSRV